MGAATLFVWLKRKRILMSFIGIEPTCIRKMDNHLVFYYGAYPEELGELEPGQGFVIVMSRSQKCVYFHVTVDNGAKAIRAIRERALSPNEIVYFNSYCEERAQV
jgi:hypothetical protein